MLGMNGSVLFSPRGANPKQNSGSVRHGTLRRSRHKGDSPFLCIARGN